jgi:hypothetical protein
VEGCLGLLGRLEAASNPAMCHCSIDTLAACNGCSPPPQRCNGTPDVLLLNDDPQPDNREPSDRRVHPWSAEEDVVAGDCSSSLRARLAPFEPDADGIAAVIILACGATLTFSSFSVRSHIGYSSTSPFPVIASSSRVSTRRPGHSLLAQLHKVKSRNRRCCHPNSSA